MSENEKPNQNSGCSEHSMDYLNKAAEACAAGDLTLGLHLYLAAYEKASSEPATSTGLAVSALREAWHLACDLRERSIAEHIFERLEPYLSREEMSECAEALQNLALDRLEEFGFSREELQDMAQAISQDFLGADASVVKVEHISLPGIDIIGAPAHQVVADLSIEAASVQPEEPARPAVPQSPAAPQSPAVPQSPAATTAPAANAVDGSTEPSDEAGSPSGKRGKNLGMAPAEIFNPYDLYPESSEGTSWRAATNVGSGWSESLGFDGTTVFDSRFEGFSPVRHHSDEDADGSDEQPQAEASDTGEAATPASEETAQADGSAPANDASAQVPDVNTDQPASAPSAQETFEPASATPPQMVTVAPAVPPAGQAALSTAETPSRPLEAARAQNAVDVPSMPNVPTVETKALNYQTLVGYDEAVGIMRDYGVGLQEDRGFLSFIQMMNEQHGLNRMPAADTMLFRAPVIEDATRFADATVGELGLPVLRMTMEEGFQGLPVLCVTADGNNRPRMNRQHNRFDGPGILVLDDLEMWRMPEIPENAENGMSAFVMANMTRGAREAMDMIRASVEDPDVFVIATSTTRGEVEPFFYELLEPLSIIDIGMPNEKERADIWADIMQRHPSMRSLDLEDLARYSAGLARYDIYMAAREAVEDAYKLGLIQRSFIPVSTQNMLDKIASCQPLDSDEYHALEERLIEAFVDELDDLENLLGGSEG